MLKLGTFVLDRSINLRGFITTITTHLSGCVQYGIQPQSDSNSIPDGLNSDEHQLEEIDVPPLQFEPAVEHEFALGDIVVTKLPNDTRKMLITALTHCINGCVMVSVNYVNHKSESCKELLDVSLIKKLDEKPLSVTQNPINKGGLPNGAPIKRFRPEITSRRMSRK
jgi:hypothetical protein